MYITDSPDVAEIAVGCGVDRIFIDLETLGKNERQGHLDTVISRHDICSIAKIKPLLGNSQLIVRVDPIHHNSSGQIQLVIEYGADIVMLPYFKSVHEVVSFIDIVSGDAKTCLLLETPEAVDSIDDILDIDGIDEIHIGLNDLHLGYGMKFMFELLTNGTVEMLCNKMGMAGVKFGFGGIARIGYGDVPAEYILAEHYRLGSTMVILSRSFCDTTRVNDVDEVSEYFREGVGQIREYENKLVQSSNDDIQNLHIRLCQKVDEIVRTRYNRNE